MNDIDYRDIARNYRYENVELREQNEALLKQVEELKKQLEKALQEQEKIEEYYEKQLAKCREEKKELSDMIWDLRNAK